MMHLGSKEWRDVICFSFLGGVSGCGLKSLPDPKARCETLRVLRNDFNLIPGSCVQRLIPLHRIGHKRFLLYPGAVSHPQYLGCQISFRIGHASPSCTRPRSQIWIESTNTLTATPQSARPDGRGSWRNGTAEAAAPVVGTTETNRCAAKMILRWWIPELGFKPTPMGRRRLHDRGGNLWPS